MKKNLAMSIFGLFLSASIFIFAEQLESRNFPSGMHMVMPHKEFDAVVKVTSGRESVTNRIIESDEDGKNAVFASGEKTVVNVNSVTINTKKNDSRGLYAALGGTINAKKVDVTTAGEHCAAFATDMGEGTVTIENAKALTKGRGSPVIYSTGKITAKKLTGTAENSEIACIEGKNSVTLDDCNISGGSGLDGEVSSGIMIYQSMSGDAREGTAFFTAQNSTLISNAAGPFFYSTNTKGVITLKNTKLIDNKNNGKEILLLAVGNNSKRGWGRPGANGAKIELNAEKQKLTGSIVTDEISSVKINFLKNVTFTGKINEACKGTANVFMDKTSRMVLTGNSYVNIFSDGDTSFGNIVSNGFTLYYDKNAEENAYLHKRTVLLSDGGKLVPYEYVKVENGVQPLENAPTRERIAAPDSMNGGKNNDMPKLETKTIVGSLSVVSDKAMLVDSDNKALLLKVMENDMTDKNRMKKPGANRGRPDFDFSGGQPPMGNTPAGGAFGGGQPPAFGADNENMSSDRKQPPKMVTFDDLKKLSGKKVEVKGFEDSDGKFLVLEISKK